MTSFRRRRSNVTILMSITFLIFPLLLAAPANSAAATDLEWQYTTTVDATNFGGSATTPLRIIYRFNPGLAPSGSSDTIATYGPLERFILEVGDECLSYSGDGTEINVLNDAGEPFEDSYDVRAFPPSTDGAKQLFGYPLRDVRFLLVDTEATMFANTALPTSLNFADAADYQQTGISLLVNGRARPLRNADETPFQLTAYSPQALITGISQDVKDLALEKDVETSLLASLANATSYLTDLNLTNDAKALQQLDVFIQKVKAQAGKAIPAGAVNSLTSAATNAKNELPSCF